MSNAMKNTGKVTARILSALSGVVGDRARNRPVKVERSLPTKGDSVAGPWLIARKTASLVLDGERNSVYSPSCIFEELRALSLGASGDTAAELAQLTGSHSLKGDWLGLENSERWAYPSYKGRITTGIWLDKSAAPEKIFENACAREGIPVARIELTRPGAGDEISRWISDMTEGLPSPRIDPGPEALACVASVLYLKDAWKDSFDKNLTKRKCFHAVTGDIKADFMVDENKLEVSDGSSGTVVNLPLSAGATMMILLPRESLSLSEVILDGSALSSIEHFNGQKELVELHLPKFTCETVIGRIPEILSKIGFSTAEMPDLCRMTGKAHTPTSYAHGAKISIDEDGLEAGAYFAVCAAAGLPPRVEIPPKPRKIVLDRPFLYAVVSRTGQPMFIGTVAKPESEDSAWYSRASHSQEDGADELVFNDEEIPDVCRIILREELSTHRFEIICKIYGVLERSIMLDGYWEALDTYKAMKRDLTAWAVMGGDERTDREEWCRNFVAKWLYTRSG